MTHLRNEVPQLCGAVGYLGRTSHLKNGKNCHWPHGTIQLLLVLLAPWHYPTIASASGSMTLSNYCFFSSLMGLSKYCLCHWPHDTIQLLLLPVAPWHYPTIASVSGSMTLSNYCFISGSMTLSNYCLCHWSHDTIQLLLVSLVPWHCSTLTCGTNQCLFMLSQHGLMTFPTVDFVTSSMTLPNSSDSMTLPLFCVP